MPHDNMALARRWFEEVWNHRRTETIDELLSRESLCYAEDGPIRGPEEFKARMHTPFLAAFPDIRVRVEAVIVQDEQVVVRWTGSGTHAGDGLGFPATNQLVNFRGMTWLVVRDGKMCFGWQSSNIPCVIRGLSTAASAWPAHPAG